MRSSSGYILLLLVTAVTAAPAVAQEVTMPLGDFDALRLRAFPAPTPTPTPAPPPAQWALEATSLDVTVGAASARVRQELTVSLFGESWQTIPLPSVGALVATDLGGLEGRLVADGAWQLKARGLGRHILHIESVVGVTTDETATRPTWATVLSVPSAGTVSGVVHPFDRVEEVVFGHGVIAQGRDERGGTRFIATPGGQCSITLFGKAVAPKKSALSLRFTAASATLTAVARTRTRLKAFLVVTVVQGEMGTLSIGVPKDFSVVSVEASPAAGWDASASTLTVTPLGPVDSTLALTVNLSGPALDHFASPLVLPLGAARRTLVSAVTAEGDGLVELEGQTQFRAPDEREAGQLPAAFLQTARFPLLVADPDLPPRWVITWPQKGELLAAQVDRLLLDVVLGEAGRAAYQCWAVVRNAGATSLTITAPEGFELASAERDGTPVVPGREGAGMVLPLTSSPGTQLIHLAGVVPLAAPSKDGELRVALPALSAPVSRVEYRLVLPPGLSFSSDTGQSIAITLPALAGNTAPAIGAVNAPVVAQQSAAPSNLNIVQQVKAAAERVVPAGLFGVPPGYLTLTGTWSALSPSPGPIKVEAELLSQKWGWF
jgi:hypothetical protein